MRMRRFRFWWQARNRHGIHSPFIYKFLDAGLYRRDLRKLSPERRLLLAAAEHFQPGSAQALKPDSPITDWLWEQCPEIQRDSPHIDLLICDSPNEKLLQLLEASHLWHNDSIIFVGDLRKNRHNLSIWKQFCRLPEFRVVLETYNAGLLFFRRQQARQHFRIRN